MLWLGKSHGEDCIEKKQKQRLNRGRGSASLKRSRCLTSVLGCMQIYQTCWQLFTCKLAIPFRFVCWRYYLLLEWRTNCVWGQVQESDKRSPRLPWRMKMESWIWGMDIFDLLYSNNLINISITNQSKSFQNVFGFAMGFARAATSRSPEEHMSHQCAVENYLMKTPGQIWFGGQGFSFG